MVLYGCHGRQQECRDVPCQYPELWWWELLWTSQVLWFEWLYFVALMNALEKLVFCMAFLTISGVLCKCCMISVAERCTFFYISKWKSDKLGGKRNLYSWIADRSQNFAFIWVQTKPIFINTLIQNTYLIFIINLNIDDGFKSKGNKVNQHMDGCGIFLSPKSTLILMTSLLELQQMYFSRGGEGRNSYLPDSS